MMNWSKRLFPAEKQFLSDRKKQAKKSFISYLDIYPQGAMPQMPILYWLKFI